MTQADRDAMQRQSGGEVRSAIDGVDNPRISIQVQWRYTSDVGTGLFAYNGMRRIPILDCARDVILILHINYRGQVGCIRFSGDIQIGNILICRALAIVMTYHISARRERELDRERDLSSMGTIFVFEYF